MSLYQITLAGYSAEKPTRENESKIKWVVAPNRQALDAFIADWGLQVEDVDYLGVRPQRLMTRDAGVDLFLGEDGSIVADPVQVIISASGGVINDVFADTPAGITVTIVDWDDMTEAEADGQRWRPEPFAPEHIDGMADDLRELLERSNHATT